MTFVIVLSEEIKMKTGGETMEIDKKIEQNYKKSLVNSLVKCLTSTSKMATLFSIWIMMLINVIILPSQWLELITQCPNSRALLINVTFFCFIGGFILMILNLLFSEFKVWMWVLIAISILLIGVLVTPWFDNYMFGIIFTNFYTGIQTDLS